MDFAMLDLLILIVILSLTVYRLGRFVVLDTMFEGTRAQVFGRLMMREHLFWHKVAEMLGCPYCITVWLSAGACLAWRWTVDPFPAPVAVWLAVCTGSLIFWRIMDFQPDEPDAQ
jgi:hypothetical protein